MAETLVTINKYEAPDDNGESQVEVSAAIEIPNVGRLTLEGYNTYITSSGEAVSLEVVELFAAAGDQVAVAYLEHVAAVRELFKEIDPLEVALTTVESLGGLILIVDLINQAIAISAIPEQQKEDIIAEWIAPSIEAAEQRIFSFQPDEAQTPELLV